MSDDTFTGLGPAERHVAGQLRSAIEEVTAETRSLLEDLEKIDCDLIDPAILDASRKETVISLIEPLQQLAHNLQRSQMLPLILDVMLKVRPETPS